MCWVYFIPILVARKKSVAIGSIVAKANPRFVISSFVTNMFFLFHA